jgi:hypothetical protein
VELRICQVPEDNRPITGQGWGASSLNLDAAGLTQPQDILREELGYLRG